MAFGRGLQALLWTFGIRRRGKRGDDDDEGDWEVAGVSELFGGPAQLANACEGHESHVERRFRCTEMVCRSWMSSLPA